MVHKARNRAVGSAGQAHGLLWVGACLHLDSLSGITWVVTQSLPHGLFCGLIGFTNGPEFSLRLIHRPSGHFMIIPGLVFSPECSCYTYLT